MLGLRSTMGAVVPLALLVSPLAASSAESQSTSAPPPAALYEGASASLGAGEVRTFAEVQEDGTPVVIGVRFEAAALSGLPSKRNRTSRCFDLDGNGQIGEAECEGDFEARLPLPEELASRSDIPFKWAMLNWHPHGHGPTAWELPHFDVHFYMITPADLDQIGLGSCAFFLDCAAFERAKKPVPSQFVHPDYIDVGAAVGLMGNHLIDSKAPELNDPGAVFTHTWIYGANDGRIIFQEVMLTRNYMLGGESGCHPIKQPASWQVGGWHPTSYCISYDAKEDIHEVSLQDFVRREGSPSASMGALAAAQLATLD